jgi:thiosulfate/3-mercaptopyruvate sulfurtransferase
MSLGTDRDRLLVSVEALAAELAEDPTPVRYRGETEPADPVAGHIPGAVSTPTVGNVNPDGTFRNTAQLAARFAAFGAVPGVGTPGGAPVGAYCGSGVTAAHEVLALTLAGIPAALYVGSWSNWIADPARPVAT